MDKYSFSLGNFITKGAYFVPDKSMALDYYGSFWDKGKATMFHEMTHCHIFDTTSFGIFLATLMRMQKEKVISRVDKNAVENSIELLKSACFNVQEGLASLMELRVIKEEKGKIAMKEKVDLMPHSYKMAWGIIEFAIDFPQEFLDKFTAKVSQLSMNTGIIEDLSDLDKIFKKENLNKYLLEINNNPNIRFEELAKAIEREKNLLMLEPNEICEKVGIKYYSPITTPDKVKMLNSLIEFTEETRQITEKDLEVPSANINIFEKLFDNTSVLNLNFKFSKPHVEVDINSLVPIIDQIRIIFIFHQFNPLRNDKYFASYAEDKDTAAIIFLEDGTRIGILLKIEEFKKSQFNSLKHTTIVLDNKCYYDSKRYNEINTGIIFYRNINEFRFLLSYLEENKIDASYMTMGLTEGHPLWTYFLKTESDNLVHIVTTFPRLNGFIYKSNLFKNGILKQAADLKFFFPPSKKSDFNNFFHYIMGVDKIIDFYKFVIDSRAYLSVLKKKIENRQIEFAIGRKIGRNERCPCGSGLKYKRCHGK